MGGYGGFVVNAIVSGGAAAVAGAVTWDTTMKYIGSKNGSEEEKEKAI